MMILSMIVAIIFGILALLFMRALVELMKIKYHLRWAEDWLTIVVFYFIGYTPIILGLLSCSIELYGAIKKNL